MKKYLVIAIVIFIAIIFAARHRKPTAADPAAVNPDAKAAVNFSAGLDGELVSQQTAAWRPIAVVIENYPDARPQSGLTDADIVYEALAEGGITRFLAFYQTKSPKNIGPVRSVRTYFGELADGWHAILAHVGGNSDALANIKAGVYKNISDADQFFNDPYFHRINSRKMPHNVYTSLAKLRLLAAGRKYQETAEYQPWQFKADAAAATSSAATINLDFSLPGYAVSYRHGAADNSYTRVLAGRVHKDADSGKPIVAKNIIAQLVKTYPVKSDTPLAIGIDLNSSGKAYFFRDGTVIEGIWKRESGTINYYDASGARVALNRGQTWVELIPDDGVHRVAWN